MVSARVRFWIFLAIIAVALGSVVLLIQLAAAESPSVATAPLVVDEGRKALSERERLEAVGALESARSASDIAQRTHRFEKLFSAYWFLPEATRRHFRDAKPLLYPTAILLAIAMPVLVALGGLAYCAFRGREQGGAGTRPSHALKQHLRRTVGMIWLVATVMLGSYVAVAYGGLFYDFTAVPLIDREKCLPVGKDEPSTRDGTVILQCFLVGRFDRWYILLGWERRKDDSVSQAPIYVKQVEGLEPFSLLTGPGSPVRGILRQLPEFPPENYYAAVPAESVASGTKPQAAKPQVAGQPSKKAEAGK